MSSSFWWYLSRASGIVAWVVLAASVVAGVVLSTRAFPAHRRPAWIRDLHQWLGGLAVVFVAVHLVALWADSYVELGPVDLLVPFASSWEPAALAGGAVAAWGLVAVEVTSLAIRRLPRRAWRAVHLTSYLIFLLVSVHAGLAGSDTSNRLYQATAVVVIGAVAWATMYRVANRRTVARSAPPPARADAERV